MPRIMGDTTRTIQEWFTAHPNVDMTPQSIAEEFGISPKTASNSIRILMHRNVITRGDEKASYRLRAKDEVRNEFKVARLFPEEPKAPVIPIFPVVTEFAFERISPQLRKWLKDSGKLMWLDCIQPISENTVIIWNSSRQRERMKQMALGH